MKTMRIAINTRFGAYDYQEGYGRFTREISYGLAAANKEDEYYFIYDKPFPPLKDSFPNIKHIVAGPPARHTLLW